jgi:hypothetical protein
MNDQIQTQDNLGLPEGVPPELLSYIQENLQAQEEEVIEEAPTIEEVLGIAPKQEERQEETPKVEEKRKYADRFDTVEDLEKSYKELQREYSRVTQWRKKFENFENLINLLEKDPVLLKKVTKIVADHYTGENKEDESYMFSFEEEPKKPSINPIEFENTINQLVERKIQEVFYVLNSINEFARKNNLDQEDLAEVIKISKEQNLTLDEAFSIFKDRKEKLKAKLLKELGLEVGANQKRVSPPTSIEESKVSKSTRALETSNPGIDLTKGWNSLPREVQIELLRKYSRFY